jgi:hypothetical protein
MQPSTVPLPINPPSPPSSITAPIFTKTLRLRLVTSYVGALVRGNVLLYLPRHIRNQIYCYILNSEPQYTNIEVPDTTDFSLPDACYVDEKFYHEATQQILQNTTFTLSSDAAVFNLFRWLDDFDGGIGYELVTNLELVGLDMWTKGEFAANATRLLWRCGNIRKVILITDLRDLKFEVRDDVWLLDMDEMRRRYDLESLTRMVRLERIELALKPFMALEKRLRAMGLSGNRSSDGGTGLEEFWGLKPWLEKWSVGRAGMVHIDCPSMGILFG